MNTITQLSIVSIAALLAACTDARIDKRAEGEKLMELSRTWSDTVSTGDLDAILQGWADEAIVMPPGLPTVVGKQAIRSYVEGALQTPGFHITWEPISAHVSESGDMAYLIERNAITVNDDSGNPVTTYGKVVTIWRKDMDGTWKNVVDMWNGISTQ